MRLDCVVVALFLRWLEWAAPAMLAAGVDATGGEGLSLRGHPAAVVPWGHQVRGRVARIVQHVQPARRGEFSVVLHVTMPTPLTMSHVRSRERPRSHIML